MMNATAERRPLARPAEPYGIMPAPATVRIERTLPGPVERVWAYLTESDKRATWLASGEMDLREGGAVALTFRNNNLSSTTDSAGSADVDGVITGVVRQCEPPRLLTFSWGDRGSEVTFELSPKGADTLLVITHRKLADHTQLLSVSAGWHAHVGLLLDLLSGEAPRSFWPEHARLEKDYAERFPG